MIELKVNEIFASIDGEVNGFGQGTPTIFIRLTGCNLRCSYCDTKYAYHDGEEMTITQVEDVVSKWPLIRKLTITGGEPLLQNDKHQLKSLVTYFLNLGYGVSIETNGSQPLWVTPSQKIWEKRFCWVVDYKLCAEELMLKENFRRLGRADFIKILIRTKDDYRRAQKIVKEIRLGSCQCNIAIGVVQGEENNPDNIFPQDKDLINYVLSFPDNEFLRWGICFNTQLHKYIWPPDKRGV